MLWNDLVKSKSSRSKIIDGRSCQGQVSSKELFGLLDSSNLHSAQITNVIFTNFMDLKYGTKTAVITETTFIFNILNLSADDVTERQIWLSEHIGEFYVLRQFVT